MKRVITAIVMAAVFLPILIFSNTLVFPIAICIMGGIAAYEILSIRGLHKKPYLLIPSMLLAMICPLVSGTDLFSVFTTRSYNFLIVAFPTYMIYLFFVAVIFNRKVAFSDIAYLGMSISYIAFAMFSIPFVKEKAKLDYLLLIICPCATDIAALYGGKFFGKKKLCPAVSQHKTVEGFFSGIIGSIIGAFAYGIVRMLVVGTELEVAFLIVAGISISIVGQYGDLIASLMKRSSNVKDFGNIFPGHGGIMDRFDSIFATFACVFIFLVAYNKIYILL